MSELFGKEHILYIIISTLVCGGSLVLAYLFAKKEKENPLKGMVEQWLKSSRSASLA